MNRDALCFVGTYYIRGGGGPDCCHLHVDDCSMGTAQAQAVTESRSALEKFFIPSRARQLSFYQEGTGVVPTCPMPE